MKIIIAKSKKYGNKNILVDDEDYPLLSRLNWHVVPDCNTFYVYTALKIPNESGEMIVKSLSIHRLIMGRITFKRYEIDHKDGDGLNNQKNNLRECRQRQNRWNQGKRKNSSSKYIGVCWSKNTNKWQAFLQIDKKSNHLGFFVSEVEAAKARDKKALALHGEFAKLNFPTNA